MLKDIASLQLLFAGIIFLWAGAWKVFSSRSGEVAARSGLALLFRHSNTVQQIHRLLGTAELALGLMLLLPPTFWWETRLATGLATGRVGYLLFLPALLDKSSTGPALCLSGWSRDEDLRAYIRPCCSHSAQHPSRLVYITVLVDDGNYSPLDTEPGCLRTSSACRAFT